VMVAAILAATMSSADTTFNWLAAVLTKDAYAPMFKAAKGREPSEKTQLLFGKLSVATMGVIAIWIALNMGKYGGAFDVYLRAGSLYNPPMFIPVMLGLIYTRTPWWSGMASFGAGVLAILIVSAVANASQGIPVDSFAAMFSPINVSVFGIAMDRYVMNTLTGIGVSSATFFVSALFKKRQGAFADRIGSLERDLATPAHASGALDVRGGQVYMFTGRVAILIGGLLMLLAIPTAGAGGELNIVTGALSIGLGIIVIYLTRRLQHRYGPETQASE
jgi:SSS family solute:Na+ symporter